MNFLKSLREERRVEDLIYILDVETNGLTMSDVDITQVAYLKVDKNLNILEEHSKYYYSDNLKDSAKITGLTANKLANLSNGEKFELDQYIELMEEINHGIIIGHNVTFDRMALDSVCYRLGEVFPSLYTLDSMPNVSEGGRYRSLEWAVNNMLDENAIKRLTDRFGEHQFHDALYDVHSLREVLLSDLGLTNKRLNIFMKTVPWRGA